MFEIRGWVEPPPDLIDGRLKLFFRRRTLSLF